MRPQLNDVKLRGGQSSSPVCLSVGWGVPWAVSNNPYSSVRQRLWIGHPRRQNGGDARALERVSEQRMPFGSFFCLAVMSRRALYVASACAVPTSLSWLALLLFAHFRTPTPARCKKIARPHIPSCTPRLHSAFFFVFLTRIAIPACKRSSFSRHTCPFKKIRLAEGCHVLHHEVSVFRYLFPLAPPPYFRPPRVQQRTMPLPLDCGKVPAHLRS